MPSSQVFAFADPIEYQAAIRAGDFTVTPTARGDFHAELTRIDFHRLWMQRGYESSPVIRFIASHRQRVPISFVTRSKHQPTPEWREKFKGKFDMGWNALCDEIFANQKRLGVIPEGTELTEWPDSLAKWETLSADEKKLFAR